MQDKSVIILAGEVSLEGETPDYVAIARQQGRTIGMDATTPALCDVLVYVTTQSAYINQGVDRDNVESQGAGDQGLMFGYACDETEAYEELKGRYFPLPAALSQRLYRRLRIVREENIRQTKTQVTVPTKRSAVLTRLSCDSTRQASQVTNMCSIDAELGCQSVLHVVHDSSGIVPKIVNGGIAKVVRMPMLV